MDSIETDAVLIQDDLVQDENIQILGKSTQSPTVRGSSWYSSTFLIVNAALGAGLLNFPKAYDDSGGLLLAISMQAVLVIFVILSLIILVSCSDIHQCATYQDVVLSVCGRKAQVVSALTVAIYAFGTCVTFFIIIGDQWDKFLSRLYGYDYCYHWYLNRNFTMSVTCILIVLPLCFSKRIDFLKYASFAGVASILYCVALVTLKFIIGPVHPGPIKTRPDHWTDVFSVVPVICFGYQCHLSVVPIYSCMEKKTVKEFSKAIAAAMLLCVFSYSVTASFGYLTFGSDVNADILLSYDPKADVLVAVVLVALKMYTTYPILQFVGRAAIDSVWLMIWQQTPEALLNQEKFRRICIGLVWFGTSLLLAVVIPDIGQVIGFLGALAAIFAFVFPGLTLFITTHNDTALNTRQTVNFWIKLLVSVFLIVFGVFIFGLVIAQSILRYGHATGHSRIFT